MPIPFPPRALARLGRAAAAVLAAVTLSAAPAFAQGEGAPQPSDVLAQVGGVPITEADLAFAAEDLSQELQSIPPDERRAFLLSVLIDMKLMANAARDAGLADTEAFGRRLIYLEDRALRRAFFTEIVETEVTEEKIQAEYDALLAQFEPETEVRARHILVPTREEALAIRAEIEDGLSFEDAAAEYGTDGTRERGGDLGYFRSGRMVAPFEEAAFALEVGEMSEPVESQHGFHLIKLEDRRLSVPPTLEQMHAQLSQWVLLDTFDEIFTGLRGSVEVEIADPELAAAVEAQNAE